MAGTKKKEKKPVKAKGVIDILKDNKTPPCPQCQLLGDIALKNGQTAVLLTLSPNPEWLCDIGTGYGERLPDNQKYLLDKVLYENDKITKYMFTYFGKYDVMSTHYELAKNGNLHSHSIVMIPSTHKYDRNLILISKMYHKIIGRSYNNCQISANTKWITTDDIYIYLNKENAYPPTHNDHVRNITRYLIEKIDPNDGLNSQEMEGEIVGPPVQGVSGAEP